MILRYLHRPHRPREIASRAHPVPQLVEVVPLRSPRTRSMLTASTPGAPLIGPDLLPRLITRGACRSQTTSPSASVSPIGSSPARVDLRSDPGLPGPFAPAPLQGLHRYYEPVRPCAPHRYSAPHGYRRLGSSLSSTGRPTSPISGQSVSGRQVLLFHASACDELTPPIHRAPPGPARRPLPG